MELYLIKLDSRNNIGNNCKDYALVDSHTLPFLVVEVILALLLSLYILIDGVHDWHTWCK